jgi:hypothetical protein
VSQVIVIVQENGTRTMHDNREGSETCTVSGRKAQGSKICVGAGAPRCGGASGVQVHKPSL